MTRPTPRPLDARTDRRPGSADVPSRPRPHGSAGHTGGPWIALGVLLAWNGIPWLVLGGLFARGLPGGWLTVAVAAVLLLLPLPVLVRAFVRRTYPSARTRLWVFRPFWYGQLFLPLLALAGLSGLLLGFGFGTPAPTGRWAVAAAGLLLLTASLWGYAGTRRLVVRPFDVDLARLPEELDGIRIVQLSDLHVGPHTPRRHLARIAEAVHRAKPDLIVLTGDQVDDFAGDVAPLGRAIGRMSAPLGVVAVAGNHDVYAGWAAVRRGMEGLGWRVLVNESLSLARGGATFRLVGLGDPAGRGGPGGGDPGVVPDVERALAGVAPGEPMVALAHNPVLWPALAERGVDLTLSGHTHHGQLAIPRFGWSLASPFLEHAMGTHRRGDSVLYISPGTNYWGIPFRIGTPPEVTVVTLRRAGGEARATLASAAARD